MEIGGSLAHNFILTVYLERRATIAQFMNRIIQQFNWLLRLK